MSKAAIFAAVVRASALIAPLAIAPVAVAGPAFVQVDTSALANQIVQAALNNQAAGPDAVSAAVQLVVAQSGATPEEAAAALGLARQRLSLNTSASPAAVIGVATAEAVITAPPAPPGAGGGGGGGGLGSTTSSTPPGGGYATPNT